MAVTLGNYQDLREKGRIKEVVLTRAQKTGSDADVTTMKCSECNVPIQETLTGCRPFGEQFHCSDCYFDEIGKWLDDHPLGVPHVQR